MIVSPLTKVGEEGNIDLRIPALIDIGCFVISASVAGLKPSGSSMVCPGFIIIGPITKIETRSVVLYNQAYCEIRCAAR